MYISLLLNVVGNDLLIAKTGFKNDDFEEKNVVGVLKTERIYVYIYILHYKL
jgi:hypothetical protein